MVSLRRPGLALRFLVMLLIYAVIMLILPITVFIARIGMGFETLLRSPAGDRVGAIADAVAAQLSTSEFERWTSILNNFGAIYNVRFFLFDLAGEEVAGEPVELPEELREKLCALPHMPPLRMMMLRQREHGGGVGENESIDVPDYIFDPDGRSHGEGRFHSEEAGQGRRPPPDMPPPDMMFNRDFGPHGRDHDGTRIMPRIAPGLDFFSESRFMVHTREPECFWICCRIAMHMPEGGPPLHMTLVAESDNLWNSSLFLDLRMAALAILTTLGFSILFWMPFLYKLTRSLTDLSRATESIAEGRFETRVTRSGDDEVGRLADSVNAMAAKIQSYVDGQKRLMGDISHELCSPIARLQIALELLQESATEDQQRLVADIEDEVQEMNNLVSELLAFSKAEIKGESMNLSVVRLKPLVAAVAERVGSGRIKLEIGDQMSVMAENNLLDRALANLIRNSLRYAGNDAIVTISAESLTDTADGDRTLIFIRDNGPGVPEDALASLGEPFFRPEASRNRSLGGVGLGLAIVKSCVAACHGTTAIRNIKPHGLEVEINLAGG